MKILFLFCFLLSSLLVYSQSTNSLMVGGGVDIVKTDNSNIFSKVQLGLEANYFVLRHFAVGGGAEIWSESSSSFVMGMRYYASDKIFVRFRGLIGANDAALGVGWAKPLNDKLRLETTGDFYIVSAEFGLRAGLAYVIR